ncbi:MAG: type II secretion system F family protein [Cryobacterium sp.]|nr:type II secretion system F family protein [Cryobacterium sp.]
MILLIGCSLGLGVLLVAAPLLWPAAERSARAPGRVLSALRERMRQAGLDAVSIPVFAAASVVVGVAAAALVFVSVPVLALAIAAGATALAIPTIVIGWKARAQRRARRSLWPDLVDHLVSAVRSGMALPDGVAALAQSGPVPTRAAFAVFQSDYESSGNFGRSLDKLKDQLADPVADRILETLRMSRDVGGTELPIVLRSLASHLRLESAIRGEVEARQSWVMNAARLGSIAPWIVLALLSTRPEAAVAYNSPAGAALIVAGFLATVIAYRIMVSLARLPEERRWFR